MEKCLWKWEELSDERTDEYQNNDNERLFFHVNKRMCLFYLIFFERDVLGGPFVSAISGGEILLQNCTFKNLTSSPTFTVNSVVKLTMEDCIFDQILVKSVKMLIFQRAQDLYGVPSVIKNTSFTNIVVQSLLIYLEGKTVSLSLINVTMKNITQQDLIATDSLLISPLDFPRGVCCSTTRNAQLFVESSNFSNIFSHCFGNRDTNFTIKSSIFDNSQLSFRESEAEIKREEVSSLDDNSGVSWIYIEGTSYFNGKIYQILIQNVKFLQNGILAKYGGVKRSIRFSINFSSGDSIYREYFQSDHSNWK